ncbi:MAG TPA: hypothetical protein H9768_06095 [Candidatus Mailhella merdavium]|nr:hypothetical protein [Candidatus Mailhella merdavium]
MKNRIICLCILLTLIFSSSAYSQELLIFGGSGHDKFLGCFNCNPYEGDSICNKYGEYGSIYSSSSIFNQYGKYGSSYSTESVWNEYSSSKSIPVLVDRSGNFYGYLTINQYHRNAVNFSSDLKRMYDFVNGDMEMLQDILCRN